MRTAVDEIVQLHQEVLQANEKHRLEPSAESRAAGDYLHWLSPIIKPVPQPGFGSPDYR